MQSTDNMSDSEDLFDSCFWDNNDMHEREGGVPSYEELLQFWKRSGSRCNSSEHCNGPTDCAQQCCEEGPPTIEQHKPTKIPVRPNGPAPIAIFPQKCDINPSLPWSESYLKLMEKIGDITQLLWGSGLEYRVYSKVEKILYNTVEELYPEVVDYRQEFIKDVCIIPETLSPYPRTKPKSSKSKKKESKVREKKSVKSMLPNRLGRPPKRPQHHDGIYQCEYCTRTFPTPQGIQSHITLSHANMQTEEEFDRSTGMHKCQFCRRLFPQEHGLKTHISCTHLQKVYKCPECGKGFPKKYAMIRHRSTHVNKDFMPQKCPYCDAMVSVRYFKSHIFTRHLYKTYKCEDCHQTFNDQAQFHKHLWTHPMKKYRCEQCPMSFNASYKLENHQKSHEADDKTAKRLKPELVHHEEEVEEEEVIETSAEEYDEEITFQDGSLIIS
ncbi:zinc finger protein 43-like isoform X1 [Bolinopsis microptera]|uniref:zinc finger protein 43-like isoform X1 n=2 Tax=Bolinopsis microptera TaxID=2820187 RepID=UPI003079A8E8